MSPFHDPRRAVADGGGGDTRGVVGGPFATQGRLLSAVSTDSP